MTVRKTSVDRFQLRRVLNACKGERVYVNHLGWYILKEKQVGGGHKSTRCDVAARYIMQQDPEWATLNVDKLIVLTPLGLEKLAALDAEIGRMSTVS